MLRFKTTKEFPAKLTLSFEETTIETAVANAFIILQR
jgi:hypothetical protein